MRSVRGATERAVVVNVAEGLKSDGVEFHRRRILLEGHQLVIMEYNMGVCRGTLENILNAWIICVLVAISAKEGTSSFTLSDEFRGAHIALLEVNVTILDVE